MKINLTLQLVLEMNYEINFKESNKPYLLENTSKRS